MTDQHMTERILDAVITLTTTRGPEAMSVRNVAAEAGVSIGAVQHHFRTKEDLLLAAMDAVNERFIARLGSLLTDTDDPKDRVRRFLHEIALGPESEKADDTSEAIVWTVFAARASVDPAIRAVHSEAWARVEEVVLGLLNEAYPDAAVTPDDAALVLAVTDGIAVARAAEGTGRMSRERGERLVDAVLGRIAPTS